MFKNNIATINLFIYSINVLVLYKAKDYALNNLYIDSNNIDLINSIKFKKSFNFKLLKELLLNVISYLLVNRSTYIL